MASVEHWQIQDFVKRGVATYPYLTSQGTWFLPVSAFLRVAHAGGGGGGGGVHIPMLSRVHFVEKIKQSLCSDEGLMLEHTLYGVQHIHINLTLIH